jgi:Ca2+/Na+ antiporter
MNIFVFAILLYLFCALVVWHLESKARRHDKRLEERACAHTKKDRLMMK